MSDTTKQPSKGLGDTIAKLTDVTGIKAVVEKVSEAIGKDCGCKGRQEKLNELFPYKETQTPQQ
jgi:hypothetical protein